MASPASAFATRSRIGPATCLEALSAASRALADAPPDVAAAAAALPALCAHLGWQSAALWLVDPRTREARRIARHGDADDRNGDASRLAREAIGTGEPRWSPVPNAPDAGADGVPAVTTAAIPVRQRGAVLGALQVSGRGSRTPEEPVLECLSQVATMIAEFIARVTAESALEVRRTRGAEFAPEQAALSALRESEARYRALFAAIDEGYCLCEIVLDAHGRPADFRFLEMNPAFESMTGLANAQGRTMLEMLPALEPCWIRTYGRVALERETIRFQEGSTALGRWFDVFATPVEPFGRFAVVFKDITERRKADLAVRASEERFRGLADAMPQLVWIADAEGRATYLNSRAAQYRGLENRHGAWHWEAALHPDDVGRTTAAWAAAVRERRSYECEHRLRMADGTFRWHLSRATFLDGDDWLQWYGTATDIHALKQVEHALQESETRFRIMADETPIGIWVTDAEGEVRFVNREYGNYFGSTNRADPGQTWQPSVDPGCGYVVAFKEAQRHRSPFHAEGRVRHSDGSWRWIESRATPRFGTNGAFLGFVGSTQDITDLKRAMAFEHRSARQKDEFIAVLAHELRNPLAPILAAAGVLRQQDVADATTQRCSGIIERQATHMARLLDDLLDVARLSRGQLTLRTESLRLSDVIDAAVEVASPLLQERGQRLEILGDGTPLTMEADPARLTQVIGNLISNAAKYSPGGGRIVLEVVPGDGTVSLHVRDNGVGIAADMRERIFELFARADPDNRQNSAGLGIGLALSRQLVAMHGGRLDVRSEGLGLGSEFIVTLPWTGSRQESDPQAAPCNDGSTRPPADAAPRLSCRILIVDDHADGAESLALLLARLGGDVRTASGGEAGIALARSFQPEVVLMDVGMPDIDGYEACRWMRTESWCAGVTMVALTGWGQPEDRQRSALAGFDHHIVKPVALATLVALIRDRAPSTASPPGSAAD